MMMTCTKSGFNSVDFFFRLLVVVRDPVTRAISDYTQAASKRKEMKTFEELAFLNQTIGKTFQREKITLYPYSLF